MRFLEDISEAVGRLRVFGELDVPAAALPDSALRLSDASVRELLTEAAGLAKSVALLQSVLAGVAASRSTRDRGHEGLAQRTGHRNAVEFIRDLTGATRGEAARAVRVGEALIDCVGADVGAAGVDEGSGDQGSAGEGGVGVGVGVADEGATDAGAADAEVSATPWHEALRLALLAGQITTAQHDAVRLGLGEPPALGEHSDADTVAAWRAACEELVREAGSCTVEDLASRARGLRDLLDPAGAEDRHAAKFAQRSYRSWNGQDGLRRASIVFDPEMGEWVDGVFAAALAPRRGGPRFVAEDEKQAARALVDDPRTNEQLAYDLFADIFRAGAQATAKDVFGVREPGLRLVAMQDAVTGEPARRDAFGRLVATAATDSGSLTVPGSAIEHALCLSGAITVHTDRHGNPLEVGREQRLFTPAQRLALSVRDGGCLWPGCDRPPAYCEVHHCDHWADGGTTDSDRGALLCRFHHLHLHNTGSRITRDGHGPFLLHPPPGAHTTRAGTTAGAEDPIMLRSKSPLRWLWDPPPDRAGWRERLAT
ncbi:DUF222 domain-containing protein [Microbacterium sp.]|uniref:HNH endonuclease signature motif containing protein n=1 Tax=Microbacterium sp. TaxID=51671 RepID=UPI003C7863D1